MATEYTPVHARRCCGGRAVSGRAASTGRLSAREEGALWFGANWPILTGAPADLSRLWSFFGVSYQQVPEDQPPKLDWWTHQPLTYDVTHTDGFVLLDPRGHERFITASPPDLRGKLAPSLQGLLNDGGVHNLQHQQSPSWTVPQALSALGWLVGRPIPQARG